MFKKVPKLIKKGQLFTALSMCNKLIDFYIIMLFEQLLMLHHSLAH